MDQRGGQVFTEIKTLCVHIPGDHDDHRLARVELEEAMQTTFASHSRNINRYHFEQSGSHLPETDLIWLAADSRLPNCPPWCLPICRWTTASCRVTFTSRNYYRGGHYVEGDAARDVIERSGKVIACITGHTHWNQRHTVDGVHYITIHSLTESFTTHP